MRLYSPLGLAPQNRDLTHIARFENAPMRGFLNGRYNSGHVALSIPPHFDPTKPAVMVLYFHGHGGGVNDTLQKQRLAEQLRASGVNAVLVAPQTGPLSQPGRFNEAGFTQTFLDEAAGRLAHMYSGGAHNAQALDAFRRMPVIVAGYSGGYRGVGAVIEDALRTPALSQRIGGVMLFDALYGYQHTLSRFAQQRHNPFVISSYVPDGQVHDNNIAFQRQHQGSHNVFVGPTQIRARGPGDAYKQAIEEHYMLMESGLMQSAFRAIPRYMAQVRGPAYAQAHTTPHTHTAHYRPT